MKINQYQRRSRNFADTSWQWQPDTSTHDPNPPITLLDTAATPVTGTLAATLEDATLAATGLEIFTGTLATTLSDATMEFTGSEIFTGTLAATLGDAILDASGSVSSISSGHINRLLMGVG